MSSSLRAFKVQMYEEHLDEIGFLSSQAQAMRVSASHAWIDAGPFEQRLEAHLDALVVGGALALQTCADRADEADAEELYGITALACRVAELPLLQRVVTGPGLDDVAKRESIARALLAQWPAAWREHCLRELGDGDPRLAPAWAGVASSRGWPAMGQLSAALGRAGAAERLALFAEVGRCQEPEALNQARAHYASADPGLREAALRAGLRLHDAQARTLALGWHERALLLALTASRSAVPLLLAQLRGADTALPVVVALGVLGDLAAVRPLTQLLLAEPVAAAAAQALHLITGAPLRELALVPEAADEDTLSEAEATRFRQTGALPVRLDGEPFGERVERLSQDPAVWGQWLVDHGDRFVAGQRYRLGQPSTPTVMLQSLADPSAPASGRALLCEELQCRHGMALALQPELPVLTQRVALHQCGAHAQVQDSQVKPGRWYAAAEELFD